MNLNEPRIREIQPTDNAQIANIIRTVLEEHGVPKIGTTSADRVLDTMFEHYNCARAAYYVIEDKGKILGGAGIIALDGHIGNVCELQKMYFLKEARGCGLGKKMLDICLERAIKEGYEKCYLETMPYMKTAVQLYVNSGFEYLDKPLGNTGHYSCKVWMLKNLAPN